MKVRFVILSIFCLFIIVGCQQKDDNSLADKNQNNNQFVNVKNSDPIENINLNNSEMATHLAELASDVPNVNDAASVVAGPYAVVAIDLDKDLDRSRVGTIKYSVVEALQHDPYGKTAVVIADADIMQRIRGMANKIRQGYPVYGFVDELAAIVGRYMPEFPVDENRPQEPDQNKEIMPENDKEKLDDVEEEQSNSK